MTRRLDRGGALINTQKVIYINYICSYDPSLINSLKVSLTGRVECG